MPDYIVDGKVVSKIQHTYELMLIELKIVLDYWTSLNIVWVLLVIFMKKSLVLVPCTMYDINKYDLGIELSSRFSLVLRFLLSKMHSELGWNFLMMAVVC